MDATEPLHDFSAVRKVSIYKDSETDEFYCIPQRLALTTYLTIRQLQDANTGAEVSMLRLVAKTTTPGTPEKLHYEIDKTEVKVPVAHLIPLALWPLESN